MNVFKVWTKQMLWTKGGQLSTRLDTEGTLNTFFFKKDIALLNSALPTLYLFLCAMQEYLFPRA